MKSKILKILKSRDDFISGEKISAEFNMTRSGIWKYINMLKEDGYIIESIPKRGYRLTSSPDILTFEEVESSLNTQFIGREIHYHNSIDSTNKEAKSLAVLAKEGTVVISEEQSEGKGRLGRDWISPKVKGIWMSIILKPDVEPDKVGAITLLGAAAVYSGLKSMDIDSLIKWPNDILIGDKKICGILTEMNAELNRINYLIMGIGINVNLDEKDIPEELKHKATSIKISKKKKINRKILLGNILNEFEKLYIPFMKSGDISMSLNICREHSASIGRKVKIIEGGKERLGKALDIDDNGELIVEFEDGKVKNIYAGEVSVRGESGYI